MKLEQTTKFLKQRRTNEKQSKDSGLIQKFKGEGAREIHLSKYIQKIVKLLRLTFSFHTTIW